MVSRDTALILGFMMITFGWFHYLSNQPYQVVVVHPEVEKEEFITINPHTQPKGSPRPDMDPFLAGKLQTQSDPEISVRSDSNIVTDSPPLPPPPTPLLPTPAPAPISEPAPAPEPIPEPEHSPELSPEAVVSSESGVVSDNIENNIVSAEPRAIEPLDPLSTNIPVAVCKGSADYVPENFRIRCIDETRPQFPVDLKDVVLMLHDSGLGRRRDAQNQLYMRHKIMGLNIFSFTHLDLIPEEEWSKYKDGVDENGGIARFDQDGLATLYAFRRARAQFPTAKWFVKTDDDGMVFVSTLLKVLEAHNPEEAHYLGYGMLNARFSLQKLEYQPGAIFFASGGSSYVLSAYSVDKLLASWCGKVSKNDDNSAIADRLTIYEDLNTALCLRDEDIALTPVYGFYPFSFAEYDACIDKTSTIKCAYNPGGQLPEWFFAPPLPVHPITRHYLQPETIKYKRVLPTLDEYATLHNRMMQLARDRSLSSDKPRFLVFHAYSDAGLGNRLVALVSSLILAYLSNRALIIDWEPVADTTEHATGEMYMMAPLSELASLPKGVEFHFTKDKKDYSSDQAYQYIYENSDVTRRVFQDANAEDKWTWASRANVLDVMQEDVITIRTWVPFGIQLIENPHYQTQLEDIFGPFVFQSFTHWFLQPSMQVTKMLRNYPQADLAMHIRMGAKKDSEKDMTPYELDTMLECAVDLVRAAQPSGTFSIFVATDVPGVMRRVKKTVSRGLGRRIKLEWITSEGDTSRGTSHGIHSAMMELYRLGGSKRLILNARSTFGHMGSAMVAPTQNYERLVKVAGLDGVCRSVIDPDFKLPAPPASHFKNASKAVAVTDMSYMSARRGLGLACPVPLAELRSEIIPLLRRDLRPWCALIQPKLRAYTIQPPPDENPDSKTVPGSADVFPVPSVSFVVVARSLENIEGVLATFETFFVGIDPIVFIVCSFQIVDDWKTDFERRRLDSIPIRFIGIPDWEDRFENAPDTAVLSVLPSRPNFDGREIQYTFVVNEHARFVGSVGPEVLAKSVAVFDAQSYLYPSKLDSIPATGTKASTQLEIDGTIDFESNQVHEYFSSHFYGGTTSFVYDKLFKKFKDYHRKDRRSDKNFPDHIYLNKYFINEHPPHLKLGSMFALPSGLAEYSNEDLKINFHVDKELLKQEALTIYPRALKPKLIIS